MSETMTVTLRPAQIRSSFHVGSLFGIAREMARHAPDVSILVLGEDGAVAASFGRPRAATRQVETDDDDIILF